MQYEQINAIVRGPNDKAVVVEVNHRLSGAFSVLDLNTGKLIDSVGVWLPVISPDRRFIFFETYPAVDDENQFRIYDLLKSPRENTCEFEPNNPTHDELAGSLRGFQVFPISPGVHECSDLAATDDGEGSNFTWSPDSKYLVFVYSVNSMMKLVLVTMPAGVTEYPAAAIYDLKGSENACDGATDGAGAPLCDYHIVESVTWDGDLVRAVFRRHGPGINFQQPVSVPITRFVPIER
jgi:hypothetical protein